MAIRHHCRSSIFQTKTFCDMFGLSARLHKSTEHCSFKFLPHERSTCCALLSYRVSLDSVEAKIRPILTEAAKVLRTKKSWHLLLILLHWPPSTRKAHPSATPWKPQDSSNTVVVMTMNAGMVDLVLNFVCSARRAGSDMKNLVSSRLPPCPHADTQDPFLPHPFSAA